MSPITTKVLVCCGIATGVAAVIIIGHVGIGQHSKPAVVIVAPETVHTSDWYLAHRDILAADEKRCAGDAASISPAACQNVATAAKEVDSDNVMNALQQAASSKK